MAPPEIPRWTFDEIFAKHYEQLVAFKKLVMIAEFGSLAVGGDRTKWFKEALADFPVRYPEVKSIVFFHVSSDATTTYQTRN